MSISYPSKPVVDINTPEIRRFSTKFVYNFFTADERANDKGQLSKRFAKYTSDDFQKTSIEDLDTIPRYVRFSWSSIKLDNERRKRLFAASFGSSGFSNVSKNFIRKNFDKILREETFTNNSYTGIEFQDTGIDGKLYLIASGSVAKMVNSKNIALSNNVHRNLEFIADKVDVNKISSLDVAKFLAGEIGEEDIPDQYILDALTDLRSANVSFIDTEEAKELIEDAFENLKNVKTRVKINNKIIKSALTTVATNPVGFFADEIGPLLSDAQTIEQDAVGRTNPDSIDEAEFDILVEPITTRVAPSNGFFLPVYEHIGYVIDKYERTQNGKLIPLEPIILESDQTTNTVDYKVAYGKTYVYEIRAIYMMEFQTYAEEEDEVAISTILVSSDASARRVVECVERIPPPPPSDVNVFWDGYENAPVVEWCFPVNPQRDIKKWQIFRRSNIDEPFELQKEIDFDDSIIPTKSYENVDLNLVEKTNSPRNFYVDKDFERDQSYIYTVCSVDAHGLSSNYGIQFEVTYNKFRNNIDKKLLSNSGAPKPYPNLYLNADTFVDTIKDSNHNRLRIYFDPEYLSVVQQGTQEEKLIATKQDGASYKMQFINVDFQQGQTLDIIIDNRTKRKGNDLFGTSKNNRLPLRKFYFAKNKD